MFQHCQHCLQVCSASHLYEEPQQDGGIRLGDGGVAPGIRRLQAVHRHLPAAQAQPLGQPPASRRRCGQVERQGVSIGGRDEGGGAQQRRDKKQGEQ